VKPLETEGRTIGYVPMVEEQHFTVGIFIIPPGARIPLHDHPDMCVVSRVLYGKMQVISLDWEHKNKGTGRIVGGEARVVKNRTITAPQIQVLYPNVANIHEFRASNEPGDHGVAILDIITPNYCEESERPCTYYQLNTRPSSDTDMYQKEVKSDSDICDLYEGDVVTLQPIPQPSDFSVFTHPFQPFHNVH